MRSTKVTRASRGLRPEARCCLAMPTVPQGTAQGNRPAEIESPRRTGEHVGATARREGETQASMTILADITDEKKPQNELGLKAPRRAHHVRSEHTATVRRVKACIGDRTGVESEAPPGSDPRRRNEGRSCWTDPVRNALRQQLSPRPSLPQQLVSRSGQNHNLFLGSSRPGHRRVCPSRAGWGKRRQPAMIAYRWDGSETRSAP